MKDTLFKIKLNHTENDYKHAYSIYYNTFKHTRIKFIIALAQFPMSILVYRQYGPSFAFAMVLFGAYLLLSKKIYITRLLNLTKENKRFNDSAEFIFHTDGDLKIESTESSADTKLSDLLYFHNKEGYLLLFYQRNSFFFIKDSDFETADDKNKLIEVLKKIGVKPL